MHSGRQHSARLVRLALGQATDSLCAPRDRVALVSQLIHIARASMISPKLPTMILTAAIAVVSNAAAIPPNAAGAPPNAAGAAEATRDSAVVDSPGPNATLAEIETCVTQNLPETAGVIEFGVEAVDRTGAVTASRAEIRWRKDAAELSQIMLRVSEPAKTAGTALLIIDRESDQPEFFLRLPELSKVKRVRSNRLRGPVLGTDFSYEDLDRLRDPLDKTQLDLIGVSEIDGRPTWLLETVPDPKDGSEYTRVLTHVDQDVCLPIQIDLFEEGDRLRKQLRAPVDEIRRVGHSNLPHVFVMEDLRRATHTVIRIERFDSSQDLPAAQFTRSALQSAPPAAAAR